MGARPAKITLTAWSKKWGPLQIKAIRDDGVKAAIAKFRRARTIINRQIENERRHYPYRVAIAYEEFLDKFEGELSVKEVQEVQKAAGTLLTGIEGLSELLRGEPTIRQCKKAMENVVRKWEKILAKMRPSSK